MGTSGEPCVAAGSYKKHEVVRANRNGKMIKCREVAKGPAVCRVLVSPR